jgi:hypothetical protein
VTGTYDPWALITAAMFHLTREGQRPKLTGDGFFAAKDAAEALLLAMGVQPVVPDYDALDADVVPTPSTTTETS